MGEIRTRRYDITVDTAGNESPVVYIGNEPSCAGWLLSFRTQLPAGSLLEAFMTCRDDWENLTRGIEFNGWLVEEGGQLFVPYPAIELAFADFLGMGGGTSSRVHVTARSVARGTQVDHAGSVMYGVSGPKTTNSGATTTIDRPDGACGYKVGISKAGGPWEIVHQIDPGGGVGSLVLSYFELDSSDTNSGDVGGETWRLLVPADGSEVTAKNTHGSASGTVNFFWKWDLKKVF